MRENVKIAAAIVLVGFAAAAGLGEWFKGQPTARAPRGITVSRSHLYELKFLDAPEPADEQRDPFVMARLQSPVRPSFAAPAAREKPPAKTVRAAD